MGDPATVDVCAAIPLKTFTRLGLHATIDRIQSPGSCSIVLGSEAALDVSINLSDDTAPGASVSGTSRRLVGGVPVLRFNSGLGNGVCEQILGEGVLDVEVDYQSRPALSRARACAITDAVVVVLAEVLRHRAFSHLTLTRPELLRIDYCALLEAHPPQTPFPRLHVIGNPDPTEVGCDLATLPIAGKSVHTTVRLDYSTYAEPPNSVRETVDGHRVFVLHLPQFKNGFPCAYVWESGATAALHEAIYVTTIGFNQSVPVSQACINNRELMIGVLNAAQLR